MGKPRWPNTYGRTRDERLREITEKVGDQNRGGESEESGRDGDDEGTEEGDLPAAVG